MKHYLPGCHLLHENQRTLQDRKSTRLNSSHANISYAVFCLKKKKGPSSGHPALHLTCYQAYHKPNASPDGTIPTSQEKNGTGGDALHFLGEMRLLLINYIS